MKHQFMQFMSKQRSYRSSEGILSNLLNTLDGTIWCHHEFLPHHQTINTKHNQSILRGTREAIRRKYSQLWQNDRQQVHHDDVPAQILIRVREVLIKNNPLMVYHLPYCQDMTLFPKKTLKEPRIVNTEGIRFSSLQQTTSNPNTSKGGSEIERNAGVNVFSN